MISICLQIDPLNLIMDNDEKADGVMKIEKTNKL